MRTKPAEYSGDALVMTGDIRGSVAVADGTVYDVGPAFIEAPLEHHGEISHAIGVRHEVEGHPAHRGTSVPFVHHCTDSCGALARELSDPMAAYGATLAQRQTDAIPDVETRAHHAAALGTGAGDGLAMALASAAAENAALDGLNGVGTTNVIPDVSLHTATPSTTGASENANSGSYARLACSWNVAASGAKTNSTTLTFTTGGTVAVTHFGTWSSVTYGAGTYAIGGALNSTVTAVTITIASGAISLSAT